MTHDIRTNSDFRGIAIEKWHGAGNDFFFADADRFFANRKMTSTPVSLEHAVQALCHRFNGLGADGLVLWRWNSRKELEAGIWNSDGSRAGTCGNALRCLAALSLSHERWDGSQPEKVYELSFADEPKKTEIISERKPFALLLESQRELHSGSKYRAGVAMGQVQEVRRIDRIRVVDELLKEGSRAATFFSKIMKDSVYVRLANPHLVLVLESTTFQDLSQADFKDLGLLFQSERFCGLFEIPVCNIGFVEVPQNGEMNSTQSVLNAIVFERGAGLTACCGSGGCAMLSAFVTTHRIKQSEKLRLFMPGGIIETILSSDGTLQLFGPAERVCSFRFLD